MLVSSEKLSSDCHTQNWLAEERDYKNILHMAQVESVSVTYVFFWFCDTIIFGLMHNVEIPGQSYCLPWC